MRPLYSTAEEQGIVKNEEKVASARDEDHEKREDDLRREDKKQNTSPRRLPVGFRVLASKPFVYSTIHADMGACDNLVIDRSVLPLFSSLYSIFPYSPRRFWQCTSQPPA